jgi:hypothetical protein
MAALQVPCGMIHPHWGALVDWHARLPSLSDPCLPGLLHLRLRGLVTMRVMTI